jgi:hypothetical protein
MKNKAKVSVIPFSYAVITTLVYALLAVIFLECNNALGEGENFVIDNDKTIMYSQQAEVETECKSPCPKSAEMCIAMCAYND